MIEAFIELPIDKQTWIALSVGWFILASSAAMREKFPPGEWRNWARAMGVLGVVVVSLQAIHATMVAEQLNSELMVRKGVNAAKQIASATRPKIAIEFSNQHGTTVSFGVDQDGVRTVFGTDSGSMGCDLANRGRTDRSESGVRESEGGLVRNTVRGVASVRSLHERAAEWWSRFSGTAARFEIKPGGRVKAF